MTTTHVLSSSSNQFICACWRVCYLLSDSLWCVFRCGKQCLMNMSLHALELSSRCALINVLGAFDVWFAWDIMSPVCTKRCRSWSQYTLEMQSKMRCILSLLEAKVGFFYLFLIQYIFFEHSATIVCACPVRKIPTGPAIR